MAKAAIPVEATPTVPPMAVILDGYFDSQVIAVGGAQAVVINDYYELWDDFEYEAAKVQLEAVERILPFVSDKDEKALLVDTAEDLKDAIRNYEETLDLEPIEG